MDELSSKERIFKELVTIVEKKWGQQAQELRQDLETTAEALSRLEDFQTQPEQEPPLLTRVLEALLERHRSVTG